jgi:hypothetical protein
MIYAVFWAYWLVREQIKPIDNVKIIDKKIKNVVLV